MNNDEIERNKIMQVFQKEYYGFESWSDIGRDMDEIFDQPGMATVSGESQGTLRITVEYIPEVENEEKTE